MKLPVTIFAFALSTLPACNQAPAQEAVAVTSIENTLPATDLRTWRGYPVFVLVAGKHKVGVDTVARLVESFDKRFSTMSFGPQYITRLPKVYIPKQDSPSIRMDEGFLQSEGQRFGLTAAQVAIILTDFYVLSGSNSIGEES